MLFKKVQVTANNQIRLFTPYSEQFVKEIKTVTGHKWQPRYKAWDVPIYNYHELIENVSMTNLDIELIQDIVKRNLEYSLIPINIPRMINGYTLRDYQVRGIKFAIKRRKSLLCFDYGTGKTIMALCTALILKQKKEIDKCLVFCPKPLIESWIFEIRKFFGNSFYVNNWTDKKKTDYQSGFIHIMNYEKVRTKQFEYIKNFCDVHRVLLIGDEIVRIKNFRTKTSQLFKELPATYKIGLTGMPIHNHLGELYNINDWLGNNIFGYYGQFWDKYIELDEWGAIEGYRNLEDLRSKLGFIMLRVTKAEMADLPELVTIERYIELSDIEDRDYYSIYSEVEQEIRELEYLPEDRYNGILAIITMLRMYCDSPELVYGSGSPTACNVKGGLEFEGVGSKLKELGGVLRDIGFT